MKAARDLIKAYREDITAADERIELARKEIEALHQIGEMQSERAAKLEAVIAAERDAKAILIKAKAEQEKRLVSLEKRLGRARKFALIFGVAAGVALIVGASK